MGQPAARLTDLHTCPMVTPGTPPVPHVGGPIIGPCAPNVLIGGLPAARVTDMCTCVGPPDQIVRGSSGVFICGPPAARIADQCMHGGVITTGMPNVLIGETWSGSVKARAEPTIGAAAGAAGAAAGAVGAAAGAASPHQSGQGGSTTVSVDDATQTVTIRTKMEFSGPGASEDYVKAAKKQIEETWGGTMTRNGKPYTVKVEVDAKVGTAGHPTAGYDPINVATGDGRMNQMPYGAGEGNQVAAAANDAVRPRRIAHEYGHTLGLDDGYEETPTGSRPKDPTKKNDIMTETWPDGDGKLPHPHQDQYEQILKNYGY